MWLTVAEKQQKMDELSLAISERQVDEAVVPLLDAINAYPDMVTVQSCSGHRGIFDGMAWHNASEGRVWIRTTRGASELFERAAYRLCTEPRISQVALMWGRYDSPDGDRPLWEMVFVGLDESAAALSESTTAITEWLVFIESSLSIRD